MLNRRYWGQGYATEAALTVVSWVFSLSPVCRVWATCDADNLASAHVLEKLGDDSRRSYAKGGYPSESWRRATGHRTLRENKILKEVCRSLTLMNELADLFRPWGGVK